MDVDAANMEIDWSQSHNRGFSQEEMKKWRSKGHCFGCGHQGHMKKDCPNKKKSTKSDTKHICQMQINQNGTDGEAGDAPGPPPNYENQTLQDHNLTNEECEKIVNEMMGMIEDF